MSNTPTNQRHSGSGDNVITKIINYTLNLINLRDILIIGSVLFILLILFVKT
jgi:hypothetical protein